MKMIAVLLIYLAFWGGLALGIAEDAGPAPPPPAADEPVMGPDSHLVFDWPCLDEDGNPTIVVRVVVRFLRLDADPPWTVGLGREVRMRLEDAGTYKVRVGDLTQQEGAARIPAGRYDLRMKLVDDAGNESAYTPPLIARYRMAAPVPAERLRTEGE